MDKHISREELEKFLEEALSAALESYRLFMEKENQSHGKTSKSFYEYYKACKAALQCIESLLKLEKKLEGTEKFVRNENYEDLLKQAEKEILHLEELEKNLK